MTRIVVDAEESTGSEIPESTIEPTTNEAVETFEAAEELDTETVETETEVESSVAEPNIPDKFAGKTQEEIIESYQNLEDLTNNLDSVESEKDLWFARGQLSVLRQVIGLEETTKAAAEELDL